MGLTRSIVDSDAETLTALVAADGSSGGFIKDSQSGAYGLSILALSAGGTIPALGTEVAASAGAIGEAKSSEIAVGSAVSLTTGAISNITSLSLEAGAWLVWGAIKFTGNAATTVSSLIGSISSVNNSVTSSLIAQGSTHRVAYNSFTLFNAIAAGSQIMPIAAGIVRPSATTSYYLNARADFATNSCSAWGDMYALRIY